MMFNTILFNIIISTVLLPQVTESFLNNYDTRLRTALLSSSQKSDDITTTRTIQQEQNAIDLIIQAKAKKYFTAIAEIKVNKKKKIKDAPPLEETFLTFDLEEHKPLGCTAEESVVKAEDGSKHVFVSKVTEGGNADMVGVNVGDVIVGVSGSFEDVVEVIGSGLDRVRSLIAGRQSEMNLTLKVIRNTNIQTEHEKALIDMCILPEGEGEDSNLSKCIEALYDSEYEIDDGEETKACEDADTECMLDAMVGIWGDELDVMGAGTKIEEKEEENTKKKKTGWSWASRSSGSGTYVRDPKTRKMVNIDDE